MRGYLAEQLGRCCMCWWSSGFCCFVLSFVCLFMQDTITANSSSVDDYKISRPYLIVESREFCFTLWHRLKMEGRWEKQTWQQSVASSCICQTYISFPDVQLFACGTITTEKCDVEKEKTIQWFCSVDIHSHLHRQRLGPGGQVKRICIWASVF